VSQRHQFGKPLAAFQLVQLKLSGMLSDIIESLIVGRAITGLGAFT
jgi:alkylation response protein AidB-like acyl-CoA dehydrogenase